LPLDLTRDFRPQTPFYETFVESKKPLNYTMVFFVNCYDTLQTFIHADDSRGSKAFSAVYDSVCLSAR